MRESTARKLALKAMSWMKWGCRCCGPKDRREKQAAHQAERRKLKEELQKDYEERD